MVHGMKAPEPGFFAEFLGTDPQGFFGGAEGRPGDLIFVRLVANLRGPIALLRLKERLQPETRLQKRLGMRAAPLAGNRIRVQAADPRPGKAPLLLTKDLGAPMQANIGFVMTE